LPIQTDIAEESGARDVVVDDVVDLEAAGVRFKALNPGHQLSIF
jgi:hypothetical protein